VGGGKKFWGKKRNMLQDLRWRERLKLLLGGRGYTHLQGKKGKKIYRILLFRLWDWEKKDGIDSLEGEKRSMESCRGEEGSPCSFPKRKRHG